MPNQYYSHNPLINKNRQRLNGSLWESSFACLEMRPLIICRGPIRMEAMTVFEEMGITEFGILLSEKDSIIYPNALSPELRGGINPSKVHRVEDYGGANKEERNARIAQIVKIARDNRYDSVFAGYGFMAEDETLVTGIEAAGLTFIGPCSTTVKSAGKKDLAKRKASDLSVSVIPGLDNATTLTLLRLYPGEEQLQSLVNEHSLKIRKAAWNSAQTLENQAELVLNASYNKGVDLFTVDQLAETLSIEIGKLFAKNPGNRIRLKAVGGGGGKGQRILDAPMHFSGSAAQKLSQAVKPIPPLLKEVLAEVKATGLGDNKNVLAEINIETVRHVEIQVVGNGDWCITLGGRDCSVQMNEQKLLEVSMTAEELSEGIYLESNKATKEVLETELQLLLEMEEEATRFGAAVGLDSVSTFECIIDRDRHYFMEMNTRVQVEHRVSELCYELRFTNPENPAEFFVVDSIVELMVLLACHGERLPKPTRERREVAALEARMNATDSALKPHPGGIITDWSDAIAGEIRDEQGICLPNPDTGAFVKYHLAGAYDSNIALLITAGQGREASFSQMSEILRNARVTGKNLSTNIEFLYGLVNWFIGNNAQARPATNFVLPYLTAVGRLGAVSKNLDIEHAYSGIEHFLLEQNNNELYQSATREILSRKTSLLIRGIGIILLQPHFLSGWLAINRRNFSLSATGVEWLINPVRVLADLYQYLNMGEKNGSVALYKIWDHDRELLQEALDFYDSVEKALNISEWPPLCEALSEKKAEKVFGARFEEVLAAHEGFQLGFDILSILPYVAKKTEFFSLTVAPNLEVIIPDDLQDRGEQDAAFKTLSPPPPISANKITAPIGGMYYASESPDQEAFVKAGQHFNKGDPLFIIEVMKMFNKVPAPFSGTVDEVLLDTSATIIKKGQAIFNVTPDEEFSFESSHEKKEAIRNQTDDFLSFIGMK